MLIVAIRPNFNKRDFVPRVVPGIGRVGERYRHENLGGVLVRTSNKVNESAVRRTSRTNISIYITKATIFETTSPTGTVRLFGSF